MNKKVSIVVAVLLIAALLIPVFTLGAENSQTQVTLDPNDGTAGSITSITAVFDADMPALSADELPTKTGYSFSGYFDAATEGNQYYDADGTSVKTWDKDVETAILYAQWIQEDTEEEPLEGTEESPEETKEESLEETEEETEKLPEVTDDLSAPAPDLIMAENIDNTEPSTLVNGEAFNNAAETDVTKIVFHSNYSEALPEGINLCSDIGKDGYIIGVKTETAFDVYCKGNIKLNSDCLGMFSNMESLSSIDGLENLDTSDVTDMQYMFYYCESLSALNIAGWNTSKVTNMNSMFVACSKLTSLDVSQWNTANVVDMSALFFGCSQLTSVDVSNWNTANVVDMRYLFGACSQLKSVNVSNWNTEKVETMFALFYGCSQLTSVDVSNWNTAKVVDMSNLFCDCSQLTTLDVSNWDTAKVEDMRGFVKNCSNLDTIYASDKFVISTSTSGDDMFADDTKLVGGNGTKYDSTKVNSEYARIDTSASPGYFTARILPSTLITGKAFNNAAETDVTKIVFHSNYSEALPVGINLCSDTGKENNIVGVKNGAVFDVYCKGNIKLNSDCYGMFSDMKYLESIDGLENLDSSDVTDMQNMFYYCKSLSALNIAGWNTSKVTSMSSMFLACLNLTSLDVSKWDTANVVDMSYLFSQCSQLTSLDVSNWNTANVEDMRFLFNWCSELTSLDVSNWDTANVVDMSYLFYWCSELTSLDVSNWDTANVEYFSLFVAHCSNLETIYASDKFVVSEKAKESEDDTYDMFKEDNNLVGGNGTKYDSTKVNYEYARIDTPGSPGYFTAEILPSTLITGKAFNKAAGIDVTEIVFHSNYSADLPSEGKNLCSDTDKENNIVGVKNGTVFHVYCKGKIKLNRDCSEMFYRMLSLSSIKGLEKLDSSDVTEMHHMFYDCNSLSSLNISGWNTSKVLNMSYMFCACSKLTSLDLSKWDTSKVTGMHGTFYDCRKLSSLNISGWNTKNVGDMGSLFTNCLEFTSVDVSGWDTSNVWSMSYLFFNCPKLKSVDVSKWDTSNVGDMTCLFYGCSELTSVDVSNWNTSKVTVMNSMFQGCNNLSSLNVSNWNTAKVENMSYLFRFCSKLSSVDVSKWDTSKVVKMISMFEGCNSLSSLNVSNWDTAKVENMSYLFSECSKLTTLDVSNWNTANVRDMSNLFDCCSELTSVDVSNWDTAKVENISNIFYYCQKLTSPDVSNWNTSQVKDMSAMFWDCDNISSLNVSNWDTSNVEDMSSLFFGCNKLTSVDVSNWDTAKVQAMDYQFSECSQLTSLNLSNWDTANVEDFSLFAAHCSNLEKIYASDKFVVSEKALESEYDTCDMFIDDTNLVGGNGTKYDSTKVNYEYARIDTSEAKGYFTKGTLPYSLSGNINMVYDGNNYSVTVKAGSTVENPVYQYSTDGGVTWTDGNSYSMSNVGEATVIFKITSNNYDEITTDPRTLSITQKPLSVSGAEVNNKPYDGTTAATMKADGTLDGVINEEDVSIDSVSAEFTDANAGTGKTVTATYIITGEDINNYTLSSQTLKADITQKLLSVDGAEVNNKEYDGSTAATMKSDGTLAGVINEEDVSIDSVSAEFTDANAGTGKSVTATYILTGEDINNYTLPAQTLTADIIPITLTVDGAEVNDKEYDGSTAATMKSDGTLVGVITGEDVEIDTVTALFSDENAGKDKDVSVSYLLKGTKAENYSLSDLSLKADITRAENAITDFKCNDIGLGETPAPSANAKFGVPDYTYSDSEDGKFGPWNTDNPIGKYYVKAAVTGNTNYSDAEEIISFEVTGIPSVSEIHVTLENFEPGKKLSDVNYIINTVPEELPVKFNTVNWFFRPQGSAEDPEKMEKTDTFKYNYEYQIEICFDDEEVRYPDSVKVTINGEAAIVEPCPDGIDASMDFEVFRKEVNAVDVALGNFEIGKKLSDVTYTFATTPEGLKADSYVANWDYRPSGSTGEYKLMEKTDSFQAGYEYRLELLLDEEYVIYPDDVKVNINKKAAKVERAADGIDATVLIPLSVYKTLNGSAQTFSKADGGTLTFSIDADVIKFVKVKVDGTEISNANYSVQSGSTIITLYENYLKTLADGNHTLKAYFTDGESESIVFAVQSASLKNANKNGAKTGDEENLAMYIVISLFAAAGIIIAVSAMKRSVNK